jgi:hypothetical protein
VCHAALEDTCSLQEYSDADPNCVGLDVLAVLALLVFKFVLCWLAVTVMSKVAADAAAGKCFAGVVEWHRQSCASTDSHIAIVAQGSASPYLSYFYRNRCG